MRKIFVIGIGVGDPDHMTMQAIRALNQAAYSSSPTRAPRRRRCAICGLRSASVSSKSRDTGPVAVDVPQRAASGDYLADVDEWHGRLADIYGALFERELGEHDIGALLVWGDPAIYDSTLRIIERMRAKGLALEFEVIPGISSVQVLAAKHRIALNRIGESVLLTTGRKLAEGFPRRRRQRGGVARRRAGLCRARRAGSRNLLGRLSRNRA